MLPRQCQACDWWHYAAADFGTSCAYFVNPGHKAKDLEAVILRYVTANPSMFVGLGLAKQHLESCISTSVRRSLSSIAVSPAVILHSVRPYAAS